MATTAGITRTERDTMGEMRVPEDALYGAQTARAVENFPISGLRLQRPFIRALGLIKHQAWSFRGSAPWGAMGIRPSRSPQCRPR